MNPHTHLFNARRVLLTGFLGAVLVLSGCSGKGFGPNPNAKVASVNGTVITRGQYDKVYNMLSKSMNIDLNTIPDQAQKQMLGQTLMQMTLQKLISDTMVRQDAEAMGIKVSEAEIKQYKEEHINANPEAKAELKKFLDQNLLSEKDFDDMLRQNLTVERFVEKKGAANLKVTEQEVASFYKKNPEKFKMPEQIKASHILVKAIGPQMARDLKAADPKRSDAQIQKDVDAQKAALKAKADKLYQDVKANPKKFPELAKASSDDPGSAAKGGELGFVVERNIDPVFWAALKNTPVGNLHNGVVETQFGYHIIKVEDIQKPKNQTLADVKPMLTQYLLGMKKESILQQWQVQKRASAKVEIEPEFQAKPAQAAGQPGGMPPTVTGVSPEQSAAKH